MLFRNGIQGMYKIVLENWKLALGMCNVTSMVGKEPELVCEMKR